MANYVDGYLLPVPKKKLDDYRRMARKAGKIWIEYGALQFVETVADDVKSGEQTSFPQAVNLKRGETVVFSFIVFRSRAQRDRINKKVMNDPRIANWSPKTMPFDGTRMIWGGFSAIVDLKATSA